MPTAKAITAAKSQFQRGGKSFGDQLRHLAALPQAQSEIALHRVAHEGCELHGEGLVKPEVGTQTLFLFLRGVLTQHVEHRVAHVLEQHERDETHGEQHQ